MTTETNMDAYKAIADNSTKEELVKRALEAFEIAGHMIDLLRILSVSPDGLTPMQKTLYDQQRSRKLRENAREAARQVIEAYDANMAQHQAKEATTEAE